MQTTSASSITTGENDASGVRAEETRHLLEELTRQFIAQDPDGGTGLMRNSEPLYESLALLVTDAAMEGDEATLNGARAGAQRLLGRLLAMPPGAERAVHEGRLRSLVDVAHWGLERSLPTSMTTQLDPNSHARRVLAAIAARPGHSNDDLAAMLDLDATEISRAGRRLVAAGMAVKRRLGRTNRWEVTPRGRRVLDELGSAGPPLVEVFAKLFDAFMVRRYVGQPFSERDLARETKIDQAIVRPAIQRLVDMGYLEREQAMGASLAAQPLRVNHQRGCAVGVSILRPEVIAVLTDAHARRIEVRRRPLPSIPDRAALPIPAVVEAVAELLADWRERHQILGIGAEIAGHVDEHGMVKLSPPLRWHEVDLRSLLSDRLGGITIVIENDANALAVQQQRFGEAGGRFPHSFAVVMITPRGEGIGSGLVLDGELYRGSRGGAGEIGHYTVRPTNGRKCRCGRYGCMEAETGVEAMVSRIRRAHGTRRLGLRDLAVLADADDEATIRAIQYAGTMLGRGISFLLNTVDLEGVLLSGPPELCQVSQPGPRSAQLFTDAVRDEAWRNLYPTVGGRREEMEKTIDTMSFSDVDRACGAAAVLLDAVTGRQRGRRDESRSMLEVVTSAG